MGRSDFEQPRYQDLDAVEAYDLEAEAAILRAAVSGDMETLTYVCGYLEADDFYHSRNRQIFDAIARAAQDHDTLDPVILGSYVQSSLRDHIRKIHEEARRDQENIAHWTTTVRKYANQRRMLHLAMESIDMLKGPAWEDAMWEFYDGMVAIVSESKSSDGVSVDEMSQEILSLVDSAIHNKGIIGIRSCIWPLDMHFMGLCKGHIGILAGRPNEGKSGLAGQIGLNVARQGHRTLYVSTEMMARDLFLRTAFAQSGVGWDSFASGGKLAASDRDKLEEAMASQAKLPFWADDSSMHSIASIRRSCIRRRPDFLIIDYIQQVKPPAAYRDSRDREVGSVADGIRALARMMDIPVLVLAQMNRAIEGRNNQDPRLADLRDSGVVENNADWVCFLQRPHTFNRNKPENEVLLRGRKNRHGIHKVWDESMFLDPSNMWLESAADLGEAVKRKSVAAPQDREKLEEDFDDLDFGEEFDID